MFLFAAQIECKIVVESRVRNWLCFELLFLLLICFFRCASVYNVTKDFVCVTA